MKLWLLQARPELVANAYGNTIHINGLTGQRFHPDYPDRPLPEDNPFKPWYDKTFGMVACAETEQRAREIAADWDEYDNEYSRPEWLSDEYTTCAELTCAGSEGIIIEDFRQA